MGSEILAAIAILLLAFMVVQCEQNSQNKECLEKTQRAECLK